MSFKMKKQKRRLHFVDAPEEKAHDSLFLQEKMHTVRSLACKLDTHYLLRNEPAPINLHFYEGFLQTLATSDLPDQIIVQQLHQQRANLEYQLAAVQR